MLSDSDSDSDSWSNQEIDKDKEKGGGDDNSESESDEEDRMHLERKGQDDKDGKWEVVDSASSTDNGNKDGKKRGRSKET